MIERIYLHIGTGKTGSTSIQRTAAASRPQLLEAGYLYPRPGANHYPMEIGLSEKPVTRLLLWRRGLSDEQAGEVGRKARERFAADLERTGVTRAIVSSESFFPLAPKRVGALVRFMRGLAREVVVICYVRHPVSMALSGLQQRVKVGQSRLAEFDPEVDIKTVSEQLDRLVPVLGDARLDLRVFDRSRLVGGDVVSDFFHAVDLPEAAAERLVRDSANESLSHEALLLCDALTDVHPVKMPDGTHNPERIQMVGRVFSQIGGAPFGLPEESYARMRAAAQPELERLEQRYGLSFPEPSLPAPGELWGPEVLQDIVRLINKLARENEVLRQNRKDAEQDAARRAIGLTRSRSRSRHGA